MSYRLYLDETGDSGYPNFNHADPGFCLSGCILEDSAHHGLDADIRGLLRGFNIPTTTCLHRHKVLGRREGFSRLKTPIRREQFCLTATEVISSAPLQLFAVCIDKAELLARYPSGHVDSFLPASPMGLAITFMVERAAMWALEAGQVVNEIVWDRVGRKEDERRESLCKRVLDGGTQYLESYVLNQAIPENRHKFVQKRQSSPVAGLEAADWVGRVFKAKGLGDPDYDDEFELYRDKIWVGKTPWRPGQTGFKSFPKDIHRQALAIPLSA